MFQHLASLATNAAACVRALSADVILQTRLFQAGILWHLLPPMFDFDFTLDERELTEEEVKDGARRSSQSEKNELARRCVCWEP